MTRDAPPHALNRAAETAVTRAVKRGRKRRQPRHNIDNQPVQITTSQNAPEHIVATQQPIPYHKRRKTCLIPGIDDHTDDSSNEEWEEDILVDETAVKAAETAHQQDHPNTHHAQQTKHPNKSTHQNNQSQTHKQLKPLSQSERKAINRLRAAKWRKLLLRSHSVHLVFLISHVIRQETAAQTAFVQALALSILPEDVLLSTQNLEEQLARMALWMRSSFRTTSFVSQEGPLRHHSTFRRPCSVTERAVLFVKQSRGDLLDLVTLATASVRAQGFRSRFVSALQPIPTRFKGASKDPKLSFRHQVVEASIDDMTETIQYAWMEVWSSNSKKWIVVDVYGGCICEGYAGDVIKQGVTTIPIFSLNDPEAPSSPRRTRRRSSKRRQMIVKKEVHKSDPVRHVKADFFAHVIAAENGCLRDVTRRYVTAWLKVEKVRATGKVFEKTFNTLSAPVGMRSDEALKYEKQEFESLTADEAIPTTVTAVQKHPRYVLERHVKRYEIIWPKEPIIAYIKKEPIFLRSNVRLLHTRDRWIRQMREVKEESKPMKAVKAKNGRDSTVDLFGKWQTEPLIIPPCVNGIVPRGGHGNVDLWTEDHLPSGTEHVNLKYARAAAKKIGVDFAPAMTGFDIRGGRSVPRIEGVVVAAENAGLVRDAATTVAREAAERAEKRAKEEALERWAKLLKAVNSRQRVKKRYGGLVDGGTYESEQKKEGAKKAKQEKNGMSESYLIDLGIKQKGKGSVKTQSLAKKELGKTHEHEFGDASHLEGDAWLKTCKICDLEVSFERL